jgi:hypothetical protein
VQAEDDLAERAMTADDLSPSASAFRHIVRPHMPSDEAADMLATLIDIADGNIERFQVLLVNGIAAKDANDLLRRSGFMRMGGFEMCARPSCGRVIPPKGFLATSRGRLFCSLGCRDIGSNALPSSEVH